MKGELRCPGHLHGLLADDNRLEVKCSSRRCGAKSGVVVLHYFDLSTGRLVETRKFRDAKLLKTNKNQVKEATA